MMAGTEVFYNGVLMRDCETQAFEQSVQYDSSGTDVLFSRFRIRVASTLVGLVDRDFSGEHASTIGLKEEDVAVTTVERMQELQARLQEVRKDFWYAISNSIDEGGRVPDNGKFQILLAATGEYEGSLESYIGDTAIYRKDVIDLNNGPKPLTVRISQVYSGRALRVEFEIEVCRCLCPGEDDSSSTPPIAGALGIPSLYSKRVIGSLPRLLTMNRSRSPRKAWGFILAGAMPGSVSIRTFEPLEVRKDTSMKSIDSLVAKRFACLSFAGCIDSLVPTE